MSTAVIMASAMASRTILLRTTVFVRKVTTAKIVSSLEAVPVTQMSSRIVMGMGRAASFREPILFGTLARVTKIQMEMNSTLWPLTARLCPLRIFVRNLILVGTTANVSPWPSAPHQSSVCALQVSSTVSMEMYSVIMWPCVCAEWTGQNCTISFNVCEGRCRNGGTCEPVDGGHYFNCTCPPGFTGQECEVSIGTTEQPLTRAPTPPPFSCENGGTVASTGWSCECDPAYTGHRCELSNPCAGNVCSVHTQAPHCVSVYESAAASAAGSVVVDYLCNCTEGWGGHDCDLDLNECLQQSICHAGNCTNTAGGYYCTCPVGWTGQHCDVRMAANCSTSEGRDLCGEGGVCVDVEGGVSCKCKEDFIGETCQSQGT